MGFELGFEKNNFLGNGIRTPPSRPSSTKSKATRAHSEKEQNGRLLSLCVKLKLVLEIIHSRLVHRKKKMEKIPKKCIFRFLEPMVKSGAEFRKAREMTKAEKKHGD